MLAWSLWISEHVGWPVVGWCLTGFVVALAVPWIVVEARYARERKRRIEARAASLRETFR